MHKINSSKLLYRSDKFKFDDTEIKDMQLNTHFIDNYIKTKITVIKRKFDYIIPSTCLSTIILWIYHYHKTAILLVTLIAMSKRSHNIKQNNIILQNTLNLKNATNKLFEYYINIIKTKKYVILDNISAYKEIFNFTNI